MRNLNPAFAARLEAGAATLCTCWRLERADGLVLGFTDHDEALVLDGVTFAPGLGLDTAATEAVLGLAPGSTAVEGVLASAAVTAEDVALGRWDGAAVERWLVDWTAPHLRHCAFRGTLGAIEREGAVFRAEVLGPAAALGRPLGRVFQSRCDARLGDGRCGLDLAAAGHVAEAVVAEAAARAVRVEGLDGRSAGWASLGTLTWRDGRLAGLSAVVEAHRVEGGAHWLDLARPGAPGDRLQVTAGCDGALETCRAKFSNLMNFRGFPHIPGEDWALAPYPAEGGIHDGGRR
jgi:uncharacterized phage protein (TIGR02218 family)